MLFVLYINDLPDTVSSDIFLFGDDTKISRKITTEEDALLFQSEINNLEGWSKKWLLKFHPDKCNVLTLGKMENIMHTHRYKLNDMELENVFNQKDLGVIIDTDLNFEEHTTQSNKISRWT